MREFFKGIKLDKRFSFLVLLITRAKKYSITSTFHSAPRLTPLNSEKTPKEFLMQSGETSLLVAFRGITTFPRTTINST